MIRCFHLAFLVLAIAVICSADSTAEKHSARLTVLYDNWVGEQGTEADWGFAIVVEHRGTTVLFDTGTKDWILLRNIRELGIDLSTIDSIVLSHDHGDHTGGLFSVLAANHDLKVYAPSSFSPTFADEVRRTGATVTIAAEMQKIAPAIYTSGTIDGEIPEQALVVETDDGLLVITGCAHPGVVEMVSQVKENFEADVHMVLGGFHLMRHSAEQVQSVMKELEELGVQSAGPTHCSGKPATDSFRKEFGDSFVALGTGRVVTLGEPD